MLVYKFLLFLLFLISLRLMTKFQWSRTSTETRIHLDEERIVMKESVLGTQSLVTGIGGPSPPQSLRSIVHRRDECILHAQYAIKRSFSPIFETNLKKVLYFGPATHTNLGDCLLVQGSLNMLDHFNASISYCGDEQSQSNFVIPSCNNTKILKKLGGNGIIYYHPGGNWGNLWRTVHQYRMGILQFADRHNIEFVSGPQTIFYDNNGTAKEREDMNLIGNLSHSSTTLTFR